MLKRKSGIAHILRAVKKAKPLTQKELKKALEKAAKELRAWKQRTKRPPLSPEEMARKRNIVHK